MQQDLFNLKKENSFVVPSFTSLSEFYEKTKECKRCSLGNTRKNFVFGSGNPNADLMLIGEAPGAEEDKQGLPFVGRSGELLTKILKAIEFEREDVYIANIIKCRPPQNRNPLPDEVKTCMPYLRKQIEIIKPRIIVALGKVAGNELISKNLSMSVMRKGSYTWEGKTKLFVTYHPAALLRNPLWKQLCWEDVQEIKKYYDSLKLKNIKKNLDN